MRLFQFDHHQRNTSIFDCKLNTLKSLVLAEKRLASHIILTINDPRASKAKSQATHRTAIPFDSFKENLFNGTLLVSQRSTYAKRHFNIFCTPNVHPSVIRSKLKKEVTIDGKSAANVCWCTYRCSAIVFRTPQFFF